MEFIKVTLIIGFSFVVMSVIWLLFIWIFNIDISEFQQMECNK